MVREVATAVISEDGKRVICISRDGSVRWERGAPLLSEWQRLAKHGTISGLKDGRFQYVDNETGGQIVAVFTPDRGLDFNLSYDASSGSLMRIDEAR